MEYNTQIYAAFPGWQAVPSAPIDSFHWEATIPYRPQSFAQLCAVTDVGFLARLWSFEENPRITCQKRNDPVWCDSCLELFLCPVEGNGTYLNFEMNPAGVYLAQIGPQREGRVFLDTLTALEPTVEPFRITTHGKTGWGVNLCIPQALIAEAFGIPYSVKPATLRGNFYKCGDKTPTPHYGAHFPVDDAGLGFHNPACFGTITLQKEASPLETADNL